MKARTLLLGLVAVTALVAGVLLVPGCGNNQNGNTANNPYGPYGGYPGGGCPPGQNCVAGGGGVLAQTVSGLTNQGSFLQLTFTAAAPSGGSGFSGPVQVSGMLHLAPGDCIMYGYPQPVQGDFPVQGQGTWNGYSGLPFVQMQLQVGGGPGGMVFSASDLRVTGGPCTTPGVPNSGSCLAGMIGVQACNRYFSAY